MNIVEAYTKFNKQCVILISGFSGSGKTKLAKFIASRFGFKFGMLEDYYYPESVFDKDDNYVEIKTSEPNSVIRVLDWDNIYKSIDWVSFNTFVNEHKTKGIVISGFGFPTDKLDFISNFHIRITISKQKLIEKRTKYLDKKESDDIEFFSKNILSVTGVPYFNQYTYGYYLKLLEDSKIDTKINVDDTIDENVSTKKMNDMAFDYLITNIGKWLTEYNQRLKSMSRSKPNMAQYSNYYAKSNAFDNFYYGGRNRIYDFDENGVNYPEEYLEKHKNLEWDLLPSVTDSDDSTDSVNSVSNLVSDSDDAEFLFTI